MRRKMIERYRPVERANHWIVAGCFLLLACSGLGFCFPAFFWLTGIFGTPQMARILHPFIGVAMVLAFLGMFVRYWRLNLIDKEDVVWLKSIREVLKGNEAGDTGRYNAGQKGMFWLMASCLVLLLCSGVIAWRPYFAINFPIPLIRLALLVHSLSAIGLIIGIIVHVYAALWIKGTIRAMVEGVVSPAWARKHHPRWYREITDKQP